MELLTSSNPKAFKISRLNRNIDYQKVSRLSKSMAQNNLLPYYPIVVSKDMTVIDGQHRLKAAEISDSIIYYIIADDGYDINNVAESNSFQNKWKVQDYVKHYAAQGNEDYIKLQNYSKAWNLSIYKAIILLSAETFERPKQVREGTFKIGNEEKANKTYSVILKIENFFQYCRDGKFLYALKKFMKEIEDPAELIRKLEQNKKRLVKKPDAEDYYNLLKTIYWK